MSKSVNKIIPDTKGSPVESYHDPNGYRKTGEKVPTTNEIAKACIKARGILTPAMEKLLQRKERKADDP